MFCVSRGSTPHWTAKARCPRRRAWCPPGQASVGLGPAAGRRSGREEERGWAAPEAAADELPWRGIAGARRSGDRVGAADPAEHGEEQALARHHPALALAEASEHQEHGPGERPGHEQVDGEDRQVDPGDGAEPGGDTAPDPRLDALLAAVEADLEETERE